MYPLSLKAQCIHVRFISITWSWLEILSAQCQSASWCYASNTWKYHDYFNMNELIIELIAMFVLDLNWSLIVLAASWWPVVIITATTFPPVCWSGKNSRAMSAVTEVFYQFGNYFLSKYFQPKKSFLFSDWWVKLPDLVEPRASWDPGPGWRWGMASTWARETPTTSTSTSRSCGTTSSGSRRGFAPLTVPGASATNVSTVQGPAVISSSQPSLLPSWPSVLPWTSPAWPST